MNTDLKYRILTVAVQPEGWHQGDGHERPGLDSNPALAVISAGMRWKKYGTRADEAEFALFTWNSGTVWGLGRIVRVLTPTPGHQFEGHESWDPHGSIKQDGLRGLLLDPLDVPADVVALVGTKIPHVRRSYGVIRHDGQVVLDSGRTTAID